MGENRIVGIAVAVLVVLGSMAALLKFGLQTPEPRRTDPFENVPPWLAERYRAEAEPGTSAPEPAEVARPSGGGRREAAPQGRARFRTDFLGAEPYERAREAVAAGDLERGAALLEEVVEIDPELTEAWYNLGAARTRLAMRAAVAGDDPTAVALFHAGVDAKRRARRLMDQGHFVVWLEPADQAQARSDLDNGLADVDELLGDDELLLQALRLRASLDLD